MTQRDLNRAIARATGESIRDIEHMGFSEVPSPSGDIDSDDHTSGMSGEFGESGGPAVLDWDALDAMLASDDPDGEPPLLAVA